MAAQGQEGLSLRITELEAESAELTKALTGLTVSGSEFFVRKGDRYVADANACVEYVRRRQRTQHDYIVKATKAQRALEVENEKLRAALGLIAEGTTPAVQIAHRALSKEPR